MESHGIDQAHDAVSKANYIGTIITAVGAALGGVYHRFGIKPLKSRMSKLELKAAAVPSTEQLRGIMEGFKEEILSKVSELSKDTKDGLTRVHERLDNHIDGGPGRHGN